MSPSEGRLPDVAEALNLACRRCGVNPRGAKLLRHFANAVFLVDGVVARVAYSLNAVERSTRALVMTHWLARQGFPATEPVVALHPTLEPVVVAGHPGDIAVTFWVFYPQAGKSRPDFQVVGSVAKLLHQVAGAPPIALPEYEPLRSLRGVLASKAADAALEPDPLAWLRGRAAMLAEAARSIDSTLGVGLIHGDLYAGNLLASTDREFPWRLGDWDSVSVGPREIDLVPTAVAARFGLDETCLARVSDGYGFDVRTWRGFPLLREIRELSTLTALIRLAGTQPPSARELDMRIDSLRAGDMTVLWRAQ